MANDLAVRPEFRLTNEPDPTPKAKLFGKALDEIGFLPLDPPTRIAVCEGHS